MSDFNKEGKYSTGKPAVDKLYTKKEVSTRKTASFIGGVVVGILGLLTAGVVTKKVGKVNIIDSANDVVDKGIDKIKNLRKKEDVPSDN